MDQDKREFRKGLLTGIIGMLCIVLILLGGIFLMREVILQGNQTTNEAVDKEVFFSQQSREKVSNITALINQYGYWDIDEEKLVEGMYGGILEGIQDPYSVYYTKDEYQTIMESTRGTYSGIGALLSQKIDTMDVMIMRVFPNSPAEDAGLKNGDIIVKVDDVDSAGMELSNLVTHIKGEEGTSVKIYVKRENEEETLTFDVLRRAIETPSVEHSMLPDNVGFIQLMEFTDVTVSQFENALNDLKDQGMERLIIDLRDNPGGSFPSVCEILDLILPEGLIVYVEDKNGGRTEKVSDAQRYVDLPLAVLVNGNSASASEIFAGAIKDYEYGTLVGTKTYGKGIVQSIVPLDDGSAVKLTTAKYFTPKGNDIHKVGIEPDVEIKFEYQGSETEKYNPMEDNQVLRAIEEINQ